jgi:hypothetical protein
VDLRLLDAEPTTDERAAIDAFLGPPVSSWAGADAVGDGTPPMAVTRRERTATSCCPPFTR